MKNFLLTRIDPFGIVDFLNTTDIDFEVISKSGAYFRDMFTGGRILNSTDRILFRNVDSDTEAFLRLKFGEDIGCCDIVLFDK
jgi:hypothetical protein